jgi:hypothetical protein
LPQKLPTLDEALHQAKGGHGAGLPSLEDALKQAKAAPAAKPSVHHSHGVGGFLHNLGSDVVHTVAGIPAGIVQTVEHPVRAAKNTVKVYSQTYGPLAHGDVSAFLHNLYSHPLGPILDAATVVTARIRRGGEASACCRRKPRRWRSVRRPRSLRKAGHTVEKLTSHNPAIRLRQRFTHELQNKLPYETPHVGEAARYAGCRSGCRAVRRRRCSGRRRCGRTTRRCVACRTRSSRRCI